MKASAPQFLHGPYYSPDVKIGDTITCAIRGAVQVRGWHDQGPISVPLGGLKRTRWVIVVSHDLLLALHTKTGVAISWYWAVSGDPVLRWRKALNIKRRASEGFLDAMSRVDNVAGSALGVADRLRLLNKKPWTFEELNLLPILSTAALIVMTGRTRVAIEHARTRYQMPYLLKTLHCQVCGKTWLPQNGTIPKRCAGLGCRQPLAQDTSARA